MQKNTKIAILMDDIANINPVKDSSLAMMLEASRREWEIYTFDALDMFVKEGQAFVNAAKTIVFDDVNNWFIKEEPLILLMQDFDVILMRKDPPFDMNYIYATYLLEAAERQGVVVVNKPQSLRDANEKLFALNFPECMPKTLISANKNQIMDFVVEQQDAVIKPLDGMGGKDIFKLNAKDEDAMQAIDYLTKKGTCQIIAQEFLVDIVKGDKRILLINGKPLDYALARVPKKGSFKGNLAAGAIGIGQKLSTRDKYLCSQIGQTLKDKGLIFVGLDVIGDYITEINVTSPTCIRELDKQFGLNIAAKLFDVIEDKLTR